PSGRSYEWAHSPFETELAEAPDWMLTQAPKAKSNKKVSPASTDSSESVLGKILAELGMLGRDLGEGKRAIVCPWEREHSGGATFNSSTVIFPANQPGGLGGFYCSHSHCTKRTASEA